MNALNGCECMVMIKHLTCYVMGGLGTIGRCSIESHVCIRWKNLGWVVASRDRLPPWVKDLIFWVIHMCPTVKARESVGMHAKPMVRPQKFAYPQKTHVLLIKKIIGGTISNGFWFIKKKKIVLENDY